MLTLFLSPEFDASLSLVERDDLVRDMRRSLLDLDVENAQFVAATGSSPFGTKSGEALDVGILAVTLAPLILRSARITIQEWLKDRPVRMVKMKIGDDTVEVTGASNAAQRRALEIFEARHGSDASSG